MSRTTHKIARYRDSLLLTVVCLLAVFAVACARQSDSGAAAEDKAATEAAAEQPAAGQPAGDTDSASRPQAGAASTSSSRAASQAANPAPSGGTGGQQAAAAAPPAAPPPPPEPVIRTYTLPSGSTMRVRTTSTLSTKTATTGQTFAGSLAEPLTVDGRVIAQRGAGVTGKVVNSDPGGRVKGTALIDVTVTAVELVDGTTAPIQTSTFETVAKSTKKKDAAKVGIASGVGAAIGAIAGGGKGAAIGAGVGAGAGTGTVLATRGEPAMIPAEAIINFTTRSPISIEMKEQ